MFQITEDPSTESPVQCLAENYKNDSIVSIDMDKVLFQHMLTVIICCHNTELVHVNGHDRIILVIFSKAL